MRRKNEGHEPELEGIAARMRSERPEASPLELDQIKTTAMSHARAANERANPRRLAVAALTIGLMAAGTGGVLAAGGSGGPAGNAAQAQYSTTSNFCGNNNGNNNGNENNGNENGNGSGNGNGNYNCNTNSFNTTNNTTINNTYNSSTVTITGTESVGNNGSGNVAGTKTSKLKTSKRRVKIHVRVPHRGRLRRVSISVNGKHFKTVSGRQASANIVLVNLPCGNGSTTVEITVTLSNGKTVKERHQYHLCTA